ncbi:MAG: Uncharacterised protein [Methanobacteriota archaeon]|nr:MAG: Uncharacterised protein [Euryarchaeota archaeon]
MSVLGEAIVAVGEAVVNSDVLNEKDSETKSIILRVLYYVVPISLLVGFYIWKVY